MRMVIDKSNGTGVSTLIRVEEYIRGRGFMYRGSALKFQITFIHVKECKKGVLCYHGSVRKFFILKNKKNQESLHRFRKQRFSWNIRIPSPR